MVGAAVLLFQGCSSSGSTDTSAALAITPTEASVAIGGSTQFSALNARGPVTWSSSDESIASVVSTGFVTAKQAGRVTITAEDLRASASATLTVRRPAALALSTNALAFAAVSGGPDPATQSVQVTDAGDDKVGTVSVQGISAPAGQTANWVTATLGGTSAPTQLTVRASPAALQPGVYTATISLTGAGAVNGAQSVVVTFTVAAPPAIQLSKTTLAFSGIPGGTPPAAQTVDIKNSGGGTLSQLAATVTYGQGQTGGWLTASLNGASAPAVLTVQAALGSLPNGAYDATIAIAASGAANSPQNIVVSFVVGTAPAIGLSSATATFLADVGGANPPAQAITITNTGGGTLSGLAVGVTYTAGQPGGWLTTATLSQQTAPATLTLRPTVGALTPGSYTATVSVTSPVASNTPRSVAVTLTVSQAATLVVGTSALSISVTRETISAGVPVTVTRGDGGVLANLSTSITYLNGNGWLTATLSQTSTPATVVIKANAAGFTPGQYGATVIVSSPGATNGPQSIAVTINVLWSLAGDVFPLLAPMCGGCHYAGGSKPNFPTATTFYDNLVGVPTALRADYPLATQHPLRIAPGDASTSYLVDQVKKLSGAFGMPTSAFQALSATAVARLVAWINSGAPRN
jgi:hypothetical protein